jgi:hypothetical protein
MEGKKEDEDVLVDSSIEHVSAVGKGYGVLPLCFFDSVFSE